MTLVFVEPEIIHPIFYNIRDGILYFLEIVDQIGTNVVCQIDRIVDVDGWLFAIVGCNKCSRDVNCRDVTGRYIVIRKGRN